MGASWSTVSSSQISDSDITQQYSGTCNFDCDNTIQEVDITLIKTQTEGIDISQVCFIDSNCLMNVNQGATSDVFLKAKNSANAKSAASIGGADLGPLVAGGGTPLNFDITDITSYQDMRQMVNNTVSQRCKMSSTNSMRDINIFAEDAEIKGPIEISQSGDIQGSCNLSATMRANTLATGALTNTATSGKDKKGGKLGGKKGKLGRIMTYVGIGMVILVIFAVIAKVMSSKKKPKPPGEGRPEGPFEGQPEGEFGEEEPGYEMQEMRSYEPSVESSYEPSVEGLSPYGMPENPGVMDQLHYHMRSLGLVE